MAVVVVLTGTEHGTRYEIGSDVTTLGRDVRCEIRIPDREVSRKHAEIWTDDGSVWVRDNSSANGTFVNEEQISKTALQPGDRIRIGRTELLFSLDEDMLLNVVVGPDRGQYFVLGSDPMVIGRDATCSIWLSDLEVSRRHAQVESQSGQWLVKDLQSTNGTFVNGAAITESTIIPGDKVRVGDTVFVLGLMSDQSQAIAQELSDSSFGAIEMLTPRDLAVFEDFADISEDRWKKQFAFNPRCVVRRKFRAGETVCMAGDYGSTAFYVLRGTVEMSIPELQRRFESSLISSNKSSLSRVSGILSSLRGSKLKNAPKSALRRTIPLDAPIDMDMDSGEPSIELGPGDLFGEMTCMNFYPRSASVIATEDCELLEMMRNVLELLKKTKRFKAKIERSYRERSLAIHLRNVPELEELPGSYVEHLRSRVELLSYEPGDVICEQDQQGDGLYLVRLGSVQITGSRPGGELVEGYLSRGQIFGVVPMLLGGDYRASYRALDHVELVRIGSEYVDEIIGQYPKVQKKLMESAKRIEKAAQAKAKLATQIPMDDFLDQGLMVAQNSLLIDLNKCTRCDDCVRACASAHDDGISRLKRDGLRFENYLVTTSCRHCSDPVCMIGCPVGSIRRRETLQIVIEDWCIGCELCSRNCPYGNIEMHELDVSQLDQLYEGQRAKVKELEDPGKPGATKAVLKRAITCDLCNHLREPNCVYACPQDAAIRVNPPEFFAEHLGR